MTRAGYDKLKADLAQMHDVEMPKILERLANARAEGDLSENAEYHGGERAKGCSKPGSTSSARNSPTPC